MPAHTKGHEGKLPTKTQIQSLRVLDPLDEAPKSVSCWPPFVSLCPLLYLLRETLTRLVGFALEP
jgi:hypothetical protein